MLVYTIIIGGLIGIIAFLLIVLFWMMKFRCNPNNYLISIDDEMHQCEDFLIYDEGQPEKVWKCTKCKTRY